MIQKEDNTHPEDSAPNMNHEPLGKAAAESVINELALEELKFSTRPVFLGLGSGAAKAELEFARAINAHIQ